MQGEWRLGTRTMLLPDYFLCFLFFPFVLAAETLCPFLWGARQDCPASKDPPYLQVDNLGG